MAYKSSSDEDRPFQSNRCPTPEEVIADYLSQTKLRVPDGMPSDGFQAARWWMARQAPGDPFSEAATPPPKKGGDWATPYHDRLVYTLRKFLKLKRVHQVYVIEHIENGVPWRGDDIDFYIKIVEETTVMRSCDKEQYFEDGFKKMHKALKGMTNGYSYSYE
jgi:hypothetical protein